MTAFAFQTVINHADQTDAITLSVGIAQCPAPPIVCPLFNVARSTIRVARPVVFALALSVADHRSVTDH